MDFHGLKRKELQALCKKHGIPANLKNLEMADRLSSLLKDEQPNKRGRTCLKNLNGDGDVSEEKVPKRVKFSPQNETFLFEKTDPRELRLLARKSRASCRKSDKIEDNPVSVSVIANVGHVDNNVEKPVERVLRRKSVVVNSDSELVADVEKHGVVVERGNSGWNLRPRRGKKMGVQDMVLSPCVEKKAKLEGLGVVEEVEKGQVRKSARQVRNVKSRGRKSASKEAKNDEVIDQAVVKNVQQMSTEVVPDTKKGKRGKKITATLKRQEINRGQKVVVEEVGEGNDGDCKNSECNGLKGRVASRKNINVDEDVGRKGMNITKKLSRQSGMSKVDASSSEIVVDDDNVHKGVTHMDSSDHSMEIRCVNGLEVICCSTEKPDNVETDDDFDKEIIPGDSSLAPSLSKRGDQVNEQYHALGYSTSEEKKSENFEGAIKFSPNIAENSHVTIYSLEGCKETEITDKVPTIAAAGDESSMLQNSGNGGAESSMQANKGALNLHSVAYKDHHDEAASTPPSILNRQLSGTLCGSMAEQTGLGSGEAGCHITVKPSMPRSEVDNHREEQPSSALELRDEMRSRETFDCSEEFESCDQSKIECFYQSRNEKLSKQDHKCEFTPVSSFPSVNEKSVIDKVLDCATVIVEISNSEPVEQEEAAGSCNINCREVEQIVPDESVDQGSSHFTSEQNVLLGPEASMEANVQTPIVVEWPTRSSDASAASLIKSMKVGRDTKVLTPSCNLGIGAGSIHNEDSPLVQSLNKDDDDARTEPSSIISTFPLYQQSQVDDEIRALSGSVEEGKSCKKTAQVSRFESSIKVNDLAEKDKPISVEQLDEVNVDLEAVGRVGEDVSNSNARNDRKSEKAAWVPNLDVCPLSNGRETPVLFQKRNSVDVAYEGNLSPGVFGSTRKASKCISVSDKTKYLKKSPADAVEDIDVDISFSKKNDANPLNCEDRQLPGATELANAVSCYDVEGEPSDFPDVLTEENHKETPSDVTCLSNQDNVDYVVKTDNYITNIQLEEPNSFNEPKVQHLVSDAITYYSQSEDQESERIACATEENVLALCDEVEVSVLFQKNKPADLAYEGNTLVCDVQGSRKVSECISTVSDQIKRLEHAAEHAEGRNDDVILCGERNVITLQVQNGELAESSYLTNAISSGDFKSISNFENNLIERTIDKTSADLNSSSCNIPLELMENQTPKVSHARDSSPFTAQEKTNLRFNNDSSISQACLETRAAAQSDLMVAVPMEGKIDTGDEVVEAVNQRHIDGKDFDSSGGRLETDTENDDLVTNLGKLSRGDVASVLDSDSASIDRKSTCHSAEVLAAVSETALDSLQTSGEDKCNARLENACIGDIEVLHSAETILFVDDQDNKVKPGNQMELESKNSDALGAILAMPGNKISNTLVNEMHNRPESTGKNLIEYASASEMEFQSLSSGSFSVVNGERGGAEGNCKADITEPVEDNLYSPMVELHSFDKINSGIEVTLGYAPEEQIGSHMKAGTRIGLENSNEVQIDCQRALVAEDQDNKGDDMELDFENSDAVVAIPAMPCNITSQTLVDEMHDRPESIGLNLVEYASARETEFQHPPSSSFSVANGEMGDTEGNYEADIAEPTVDNLFLPSVESHSFDENKGNSDIEVAFESAPEEQIDSNMDTGNRIGQEKFNEEQIDCQMESAVEDACTSGNDNLVASRSEDLDSLPGDIGEVSLAETNIVHGDSFNSKADLEICDDEAYDDSAQETDPTKGPDVENCQDDRGGSVEKEAYMFPLTPPLIDATSSNSLIAMHDVLDSTSSLRFVDVSGVHKMEQEVSRDFPSTLLDQEKDDVCSRANVKSGSEDNDDDFIHVGRASKPLFSIYENIGVDLHASEDIVIDYSVGNIIPLSNSMDKCSEVAAEQGNGRNGNDCEASGSKADADSSSPYVFEYSSDQVQEQNHTPLMQTDLMNWACQPGTTMTVPYENEDKKSNIKSFAFTDSEIDLFWGGMAEVVVREPQTVTEASDVTFSVNEYEIANIEHETVDIHHPAVEEIVLPVNLAREEVVVSTEREHGDDGVQTLQDGITVDEQNSCSFHANKSDEKREDLDTGDKLLMSTMIKRMDTRTILIHGTPQKPFIHDMKENASGQKRMHMVDVTTVKPGFKRKALEDIGK